MPIYTFTTNLLSAQKLGSPTLANTTLSGVGVRFLSGNNVEFANQQVVVVSLSTTDVGIAYTPIDITVSANSLSTFSLAAQSVITVNALGSVFRIPALLTGSPIALIETNGTYTTFQFVSGTTTYTSLTATVDVSTPNSRRLRVLGYK